MLDRRAELAAIRSELDGYQEGWAEATPTAEAIVELRDYLDFALPVGEALRRWGGDSDATAADVCHWLSTRLHLATVDASGLPQAELDADFAVTAQIIVQTTPSGTWWIIGVDPPGSRHLDTALLMMQHRTGNALRDQSED